MNTWINYHHLFYFKTIADEGTVSAAAVKLRLGQPTLSAQLKQFEENLGVALFLRTKKRLILTEQGKVALDYATGIFKMGNEMLEVLQDRLVPTRTHLQIGAIDSFPKDVVLQIAKAAYKLGNCHVTLSEGRAEEILIDLLAHRIDIFATNQLPAAKEIRGLTHRLIGRKPIGIYGSAKFKALRRNFPGALNGQPFIMPTSDSRVRLDFERWFNANGISIDIIADTQDIGLKKMMAIEGLGLIPAGSQTVARQVLEGTLVQIGEIPALQEELYLISAHRKIPNPLAKILMRDFKL